MTDFAEALNSEQLSNNSSQELEQESSEQFNQNISNEQSQDANTDIESDDIWYWDEHTKGEGKKPDFFNDKKYKSILDQAKAQRDLEHQFGSFTGAPEEYNLEPLKEVGVEPTEDDPLLNNFKALAKDMNMSQDGFEKVVQAYVDSQSKQAINPDEELKKLGDDGMEQVQSLTSWAQNNLSEDEYNNFLKLPFTAENINILNKLKGESVEKPIPGNDHHAFTPKLTRTKIRELISDPRYQDPYNEEYRQEVRKKIEKFVEQNK